MALPQINCLVNGFGADYANGTATGYHAGTSTLVAWYEDAAATIPASNPYILSSTGNAVLYSGERLKIDVKNSDGTSAPGFPVDNLGFSTYALDTWVIASSYGPTLNSTTVQAAITAIGSDTALLYLDPGTWSFTDNITVPKNVTLKIEDGGIINVSSGKTLTINGSFNGSSGVQYFSGSGTVAGLKRVLPEWFGAVADGVTDCATSINSAYTATATGGVLQFVSGTYLMSGAVGLIVGKSMTLDFHGASKLLFNHNNATYIEVRASNVTLNNIYIDGGSTSWTRTDYFAINANSLTQQTYTNINIIKPRVENVAGGGIALGSSITIVNDSLIDQPVVKYTQADGVSIIGECHRINIVSPKVYHSGDDSVSVVSYSSAAAAASDITITGMLSVDSVSRGLAIIGASDVYATGVVRNSTEQGVLVFQDTGTYATYAPARVNLDMVCYSTLNDGISIGKGCTDVILKAVVSGATGRGIVISNATTPPERIEMVANVYSSTTTGIEIGYCKNISLGSITVANNGTYGLATSTGCTNLSAGSITAYNNNTTSTASVDNILILGVTGFSIGSVLSIDDNASPKIERTLDVSSSTNGIIGSFLGIKNTTITAPNIQNNCTNVVCVGGNGVAQYGCVGTVSAAPTETHFPAGTFTLDSTANKAYFYNGSAWKAATLA